MTMSTAGQHADRDGDGIPDAVDECPDEKETYNGCDDQDGCPDKALDFIRAGSDFPTLFFAPNRAAITPAMRRKLDEIVATMVARPEWTSIAVGGAAAPNERDPDALSQRRAEHAMAALIERGVAQERLQLQANGAANPPVVDHEQCMNETERCRAPARTLQVYVLAGLVEPHHCARTDKSRR